MSRYRREVEEDDGWTRWIEPIQGYKLACCDCGLVHDTEWKVLKVTESSPKGNEWNAEELPFGEYRISMRVRRNNRATGQMRRKKA